MRGAPGFPVRYEMIMKRISLFALILMILVLLTTVLPVSAEDTEKPVETVTFKRLTVPADAESIDLGKNKVGIDDYKDFYNFLSRLPNLKHVDMFNTRIPAQRINELTEKFPGIEFGWTMIVGNHDVRTDITAFSTAHSDAARRHSDQDFALLKYCKNLLALDIGHNAVKDLSFLYDLPNLKVLIVVDNQFTDLTPIASLHELEYLEIFYNKIRDITPLAGLTKLLDLNICFNYIEDLTPLYGLTGLKRLWISQYNDRNPSNKPDPAAVEALRAALPDTQIDSNAKSSVGNYWRDHPHYKVLREMFNKQMYIPFEDSWQADE